MQVEGTPCLYFSAGIESELPLSIHFGGGSERLTFTDVAADEEVSEALGIESISVENGLLKIRCTKTGTGLICVTAIVGGTLLLAKVPNLAVIRWEVWKWSVNSCW